MTRSILPKFIRYLIAFTNKNVLAECIDMFKNKRFNISKLKRLLSFVSSGYQNLILINKVLKNLNFLKDDRIVFYSYWMDFHAYVAVNLKLKYPFSSAVSRCHGYDLYEYRNNDNYIPLRRFLMKGLDVIFCISDDGKNYLERMYPNFKKNILVSKLGTVDYGFKEALDNMRPLKIASCAWVSPVKRIHRIVEALALINEIQIEWTHFGGGDLASKINNLCQTNLGCNIKYNLVGSLSNQEIINFYKYNDFHIFINVSKSEGIPVSIMEALSFGIPVIATDVGGVKEIVQENYNGYLLREDFLNNQLVELIYKISSMHYEEYRKMRKNARQSWYNKFKAEVNYTNFNNKLNEVIEQTLKM